MKTLALCRPCSLAWRRWRRAQALDLDPHLPAYQPVPIGSAQIKSVGSDTLGDLMRSWADEFAKLNPNVKIEVESKGSSTAPPALLDGVAQLAPMSRPMRSEEYEPFEKKYGYHPTSFPVAVDALAVYVNKDNPIECLTSGSWTTSFPKPISSWRHEHKNLGRRRLDRGLGRCANLAFWTKFRFGHS